MSLLNSTVAKTAVGAVAVVAITGLLLARSTQGTNTVSSTSTTVAVVSPPAGKLVNQADATATTKVKLTSIDMSEEKVVFLSSGINAGSVSRTLDALERARQSGASRIYLVIDSPGGSVFDGVKLVNYIKGSKTPIDTVCSGLCASMGAHIHQAGARRLMTLKSVLMFHPASGGAQGTIEQMLNQLNTIQLYIDRMDAEIAQRSGMDYKTFKARLSQELWIETVDALKEKLADGAVNLVGSEPAPVVLFGGDGGEQDKRKRSDDKDGSDSQQESYEVFM